MRDELVIREFSSGVEPLPGLYNMPNEVYHAGPGLSSTGIKEFAISPANYKYGERKETEAMSVGQLFHDAALQPELYAQIYQVTDQVRSKKRKEDAAGTGIELIKLSDHQRVIDMVRALYEEPDAASFMGVPGHNEIAMYWMHPRGFLAKCKPDKACPGIGALIDLKKTQDPSPYAFQKSIVNYKYHWSAAWYLDGATAATDMQFTDFIWIVVQEKRPNQVNVYTASRELLSEARAEMQPYIEQYAECLAKGDWPKRDGSCQVIDLPRYHYKRSEYLFN